VKKIALAAAAMGGTALIAFGASGTFAAFSDTEQAFATAGAGTLDLAVAGGQVATAPAAVSLSPGQSTQLAYWVNNVGTVGGALKADLSVLENAENNCSEPETESGDTTCGWATGGEFAANAIVRFLEASAPDEAACRAATTGTTILAAPAGTLLAAQSALPFDVFAVDGESGKCLVVNVSVPVTAGNNVQGDTAKFQVDLSLTQVTEKLGTGIDPNPRTPIKELPFVPGNPIVLVPSN
jgi:hypothetical protein